MISRYLLEPNPAAAKTVLASLWCSGSWSTLVRTEPGRIPLSSQIPDVPQPVPISTAAFALMAAARKRSTVPVNGATGTQPPICSAFARAVKSGSSSMTNSSAIPVTSERKMAASGDFRKLPRAAA